MQIRMERDLSHNYLVPVVRTQYTKDDYQIHMLLENQIPGLLPMNVHHMDGMTEYYFDITGQQSLEALYGKTYMREEDILQVIKALFDVIHEIEKYLLRANGILLDPSCIYLDEQKKGIGFCYLPGNEMEIEDAFRDLAEYILHHLDQNDPGAVLLGYEIYRQASQKMYSLEMILKKAFEGKGEEKKPREDFESGKEIDRKDLSDKRNESKSVKDRSEQKKDLKKEIIREPKKKSGNGQQNKQKKSGIILFSGIYLFLMAVLILLMLKQYLNTTQGGGIAFLLTGIFGFLVSEQKKEHREGHKEGKRESHKKAMKAEKEETAAGATVVLWEGEEEYTPKLSLIGMNSRDRMTVVLQKDTYVVGKQKSKTDICINDPAVSRIHARITKEDDGYYLTDLNSTNGTFHNGVRLENGEKVRLELTDEITFAESGFYVGNC